MRLLKTEHQVHIMLSSSQATMKPSASTKAYRRIAVNGQRVFTSMGAELETMRLGPKEPGEIINLGDEEKSCIQDLILNESKNFLAIVREHDVVIADISRVRDTDDNVEQNLVLVRSERTDDNIISALWHPASSTKSHLVVLSSLKIAIYDFAISPVPRFELFFENWENLKGQKVNSMAFGSSFNFAGSTSLYISTDQGSVFVVTPFMYNGFPQRFTTKMIAQYLQEADACFHYLQRNLPPSYNFIPVWTAVLKYNAYRSSLRNLYNTHNMSGFEDTKEWSFKVTDNSSPQIVGPVAQRDTECKLLNVAPLEPTSVLACMGLSQTGEVEITYFSQVLTLIYACEFGSIEFKKPIAPKPQEKPAGTIKYKKPTRGFGFQVVEDKDEQVKTSFSQEIENYKLEIADYHALQTTTTNVTKKFNLLTTMKDDQVKLKCNSIHDVTWQTLNSWLVLNLQGKMLVSNIIQACNKLHRKGIFEPKYFLKKTQASAFGFLDDVNRYELALLTFGQDFRPLTFAPNKVIQEAKSNPSYKSETRATSNGNNTMSPADELKSYLTGPVKAKELNPVDTDSSESLRNIFEASTVTIHKIKCMTLFILALQSTLAIQHGELKLQQQGLKEIPAAKSFKIGEDTEARIGNILARQEQLSERAKALYTLITNSLDKSKKMYNLPLSDAEKTWFRELNSVTKEIGTGNEESRSLQLIVRNLTEQVNSLDKRDTASVEKLTKDLETLRMSKSWQRLSFILKHEQKKLSDTKLTVDSLLHKLEDFNLGVSV